MNIDQITKRVLELMREEGLNTNDLRLVMTLCIIYTTAQRDQLARNLNENVSSNYLGA